MEILWSVGACETHSDKALQARWLGAEVWISRTALSWMSQWDHPPGLLQPPMGAAKFGAHGLVAVMLRSQPHLSQGLCPCLPPDKHRSHRTCPAPARLLLFLKSPFCVSPATYTRILLCEALAQPCIGPGPALKGLPDSQGAGPRLSASTCLSASLHHQRADEGLAQGRVESTFSVK